MVLITGGAGFIGSNFINYILKRYSGQKVVNFDLLTYAGNLANLKHVEQNPNYIFIRGDIADSTLVSKIFARYKFKTIINFAAETHVDRSITNPDVFLRTNILGTQTLLDAALKSWRKEPDNKYCREFAPEVKFIQISTDEVYGSLGDEGFFTESTPLAPNSPYSASKAAADLLVSAYWHTYGLPINITRCSNNYGPYQFPEKLIPLMLNNCLNNKSLPVYGDGLQVRDWLYVEDHCSAIDIVRQKGISGEIYNIGGNNEKTNIEIVKLLIEKLNKKEELISYVRDRPGHDRRYAIDNTKITSLGWSPSYTFEQGIQNTIDWHLSNSKWFSQVISGEYSKYYEKMYSSV